MDKYISLDAAVEAVWKSQWMNDFEKGVVQKMLHKLPAVDAVPVVYCDDCVNHGNCIPEDTFRLVRIEKPFCCVGKKVTDDG